MNHRAYVAPASGRTYDLGTPLWRDPGGSGHVNLTSGDGMGRADIDARARGPWRYRAALALDGAAPVTLGEGGTPLVPGTWLDAPVLWKLECLAPTGSFKDRGTAVMVSYLKGHGITRAIEDSSGNAGASVAAYAAAAGLESCIYVPAAASPAKLVQMRAAGAEVIAVEGSRSLVTERAMAAAEQPGAFYASHNRQPHFLEGTKTLAYELWEDLDFDVPDAVVMPVGGGSNLLGCHFGFGELLRAGQIQRLPRLYAVQPTACAPLARAWNVGAATVDAVTAGTTVAEGIVIAEPTRGREMLCALKETGGGAIAVDDDAICAALLKLARAGLLVEPTSAAAAAGLAHLLTAGHIEPGDKVVVVLTGHGLKAAGQIGSLLGV